MNRYAMLMLSGCFCLTIGTVGPIHRADGEVIFPSKEETKKEVAASLSQMTLVKFPDKHFDFKYPKNWQEEEPKDGPMLCTFRDYKGLVSARFAVEDLPPTETLASYGKVTDDQIKQTMAAQKILVTTVDSKTITVSGVPAQQTIYTYNLPDTNVAVKVLQVLTINKNRGYVFNYTAVSNMYDDFLGVIEAVIKSIELQ